MDNKNITVLLAVHNRKNKTLSCLRRLFEQSMPDKYKLKVYLCDDNSTDGTSDAVLSLFYDKVIIIHGNGELYWNRGMYTAWIEAVKHEKSDYFLWLNDDTFLEANAITQILEVASENSIIVGSTCSVGKKEVYTYGGYKDGQLLKPKNKEIIECDYFNGNIVLVPLKVVEKIGILDPYFRHSFGDFEYGLRAKRNGIKSFAIGIVGSCDRNSSFVKWMDPKLSVIKRLKILYSPLGFNPFEAYRVNKYKSMKIAALTFVYLHAKAIFPSLFKQHRS